MSSNVRRLERKHAGSKRLNDSAPSVASGLHAATLEFETSGGYQARVASGELVPATLAEGVAPELATEALRDRRTVLVSVGASGAVLLGALQTKPTASAETLHLRAPSVEIEGREGVVLRAGKASLVLEPDGTIRLVGDAMTMRVAQLLRVLAANVELP